MFFFFFLVVVQKLINYIKTKKFLKACPSWQTLFPPEIVSIYQVSSIVLTRKCLALVVGTRKRAARRTSFMDSLQESSGNYGRVFIGSEAEYDCGVRLQALKTFYLIHLLYLYVHTDNFH